MAALESLQLLVDLDASGLESKINSTVNSITGAFSKFDKLDFNSLLGGVDSINWTSIVGKLFAPANLIAFFSAMSATGIISALQLQSAGTAAAGASGLTQTQGSSAGATVTSGSAQVLNTIGTTAGSINDVSSAFAQILGYVQQFGGSTQDAVTLTTQLGQALQSTGGVFSSQFDSDFVSYLQNIGATTSSQIEQVIANLESSKQASDGQLASIDAVIQSTNDFVKASASAGASFDSINESIVRFGVESAANSQSAQAGLQVATQLAQGNLVVAGELGVSQANFVKELNGPGGANEAWDLMNQKISALPVNQTVAEALGIPLAALQGAEAFVTLKSKLDDATNSLTQFNGAQGLQYTASQFADTLSVTDKLDIAWQNLADTLGSVALPWLPGLSEFLNDTSDFIKLITTGTPSQQLSTDVTNLASSVFTPKASSFLSNNSFAQWLQSLVFGPSGSPSTSNSSAKVQVSVTASPGTQATVTQNGVNGLSSSSGSPASSNITVTSK